MEKQEFPKWMYHKDHEAKVIDADQYNECLETGWVGNPENVNVVVPKEVVEEVEKQKLYKPRKK